MKLKCLIVDDEPPATRIIESYLLKLEGAEIAGTAANAIEAFNYLQKQEVDILFLDVNMPEISGLNLLKILKNPPSVILTTAYSEYALESYEYNVTDYLLKPIRFERFIAAFEKAKAERSYATMLTPPEIPVFFELKLNGEYRKIPLAEIRYVQSLGNYVKVYTGERVFVTLLSTKEAEAALPKTNFVRIHKSYIVNLNKVSAYNNEEVMIGSDRLPIGKTYKKYFIERKESPY